MTGFVYKWTNTINGKWYIGSRKGTPEDGYRHTSKVMLAAEKKYGIENFTREILFEGDYDKDQIRSVVEANYLREEDAANNPMSYNQSNITGPNCVSKETRRKRSESSKGRKSWCKGKTWEEMHGKDKAAEMRANHPSKGTSRNKGVVKSKKHRTNISESIKELWQNEAYREKNTRRQQIIECPHCKKSGGVSGMKRYHFDRCKINED